MTIINSRICFILMILTAFYACQKEKVGYNFIPSGNYVNADQNNGSYIDKSKDVEKSFIDLNTLSIALSNANININIGLLKMPDSLIYSQIPLQINSLNYEWAVYFDMDNSSSLTKGDISISIKKFKMNDSSIIVNNILTGTQKNIWLYDGTYFESISNLDKYISLNGNNICFSIPRSLDTSLLLINNKTNFYFQTTFNDGTHLYKDYYPDRK